MTIAKGFYEKESLVRWKLICT